MPRQSGDGIGSLFAGLARAIAPAMKAGVKSLAKRGLVAAANVAGDVVRGENVKTSAKRRLVASGKDLLSDLTGAMRPDVVKRRARKRKAVSKKRADETSAFPPLGILTPI